MSRSQFMHTVLLVASQLNIDGCNRPCTPDEELLLNRFFLHLTFLQVPRQNFLMLFFSPPSQFDFAIDVLVVSVVCKVPEEASIF